jgi:hypothetical protein
VGRGWTAEVFLEGSAMFSTRFLSVTALVVGLAVLACPVQAADKDTGSVEGKITFAGKSLTKGKVSFHPRKGKPVVADIKADGTYSARKVPVGEVRISIKSKGVPEKYASPKTSGLTLKVTKGKQEFNIELK